MKYAAFIGSLVLLAFSLALSVAQEPPASVIIRGVDQDPIEEFGRFPDSARDQKTPPSPQPKDWLMIPHGGLHSEGCERVSLQDLEMDFDATKREAERIRKLMLAADFQLTPGRIERMRLENATSFAGSLDELVRDKAAMIALGKAFFWDQQVGSDGQTACASCHFKAGADGRGVSIGVALRRMTDDPALPDGTEPSRPLGSDELLQMYKFRWSGMMDFDRFISTLVVRAMTRLETVAAAGSDSLEAVREELDRISLKDSAPAQIKQQWRRLNEAIFRKSEGKPLVGTELLTIAKLTVNGLLFIGHATQKSAQRQIGIEEKLPELRNRWKGYTDDQLRGAQELGGILAPNESRRLSPNELENSEEKNPRPMPDTPVPNGAEGSTRKTPAPEVTRQGIRKNTPTVINAALYDRLFHNARAASAFNGYDHLGDEAGRDGYGKWTCRNGRWEKVLIRIPDAALASQATAPLLSSEEMSWFGRQYHHVARKMLDRRPLQFQSISPDDSHLKPYLKNGRIENTYRDLIKRAFRPEWWCGGRVPGVQEQDALTGNKLQLDQFEANFSLFWGIALMYYQNELISNTSEFDSMMSLRRQGKSLINGKSPDELSRINSILNGFKTFQEHACADCHRAPEFADATRATVYGPLLEFEGPLDAIHAETETNELVDFLASGKPGIDSRIERMPFRPAMAPRFYDAGIYNVGVTSDRKGTSGFDPGVAGEAWLNLDSENDALTSIAQRFGQGLVSDLLDRKTPVTFSLARRHADEWSSVIGSFKTPTIRNVELTAPYFHSGDPEKHATLDQVLEHYDIALNNLDAENEFLHPALRLEPGAISRETAIPDSKRADVIVFLKSLTDSRVRENRAPFDHPTLLIPVTTDVDELGQTKPGQLKPTNDF